jgi:hypothetical protein
MGDMEDAQHVLDDQGFDDEDAYHEDDPNAYNFDDAPDDGAQTFADPSDLAVDTGDAGDEHADEEDDVDDVDAADEEDKADDVDDDVDGSGGGGGDEDEVDDAPAALGDDELACVAPADEDATEAAIHDATDNANGDVDDAAPDADAFAELALHDAVPETAAPPTADAKMRQLEASYSAAAGDYARAHHHVSDATDLEAAFEDTLRRCLAPDNQPGLGTYVDAPPPVQRATLLAAMHQFQARVPRAQRVEDTDEMLLVEEYTLQAPPCVYLNARFATSNCLTSKFVYAAQSAFYYWRAFCTVHARMRARNYVLLRGYPPMDFCAFAHTFLMGAASQQRVRKRAPPVAFVERTAFASWADGVTGADAPLKGAAPHGLPRALPVTAPWRTPVLAPHALHAETATRPAFTIDQMAAFISPADVARRLSMYFAHVSYVHTTQRPGCVRRPLVFEADPARMRLRKYARRSPSVFVCFTTSDDARKQLADERAHNVYAPEWSLDSGAVVVPPGTVAAPTNAPIPIDELFAIVDKPVSAAFRTKTRALHTNEQPAPLRCVWDVWPQELLWTNPFDLNATDRMEITSEPPADVAALARTDTEAACELAFTKVKISVDDTCARFLGARVGNFIDCYKSSTTNSLPVTRIVVPAR